MADPESAKRPAAGGERPVAARTLLVSDKEREGGRIQAFLEGQGFNVFRVATGESAYNVLDEGQVDVLVVQIRGRHIDGLKLQSLARSRHPGICVILLASPGEVELATQAMWDGAHDFQTRPVNLEKMAAAIRRGLEYQRMTVEVADLTRRLDKKYGFHNILGNSGAVVAVFKKIMQVAPTKDTVLLTGEIGTGKDLVATALHHNSARRNAPFVKLSCTDLAESVVESEIFGRERTASGRPPARRGRLEIADGGTLFLDEVGALGPRVQAKLARWVEEEEFQAVGGRRVRRSDVRIVASTQEDLPRRVAGGAFRRDLFEILSMVTIELPPLRQRRSDIPLLAHRFLEEANREFDTAVEGFTRRAMDRLQQYAWPGNVRELKNRVSAVVLSRGRGLVDLDALPGDVVSASPPLCDIHLRVGMSLEEVERVVIEETLARMEWDRPGTAKTLGIGLRTLYRKIKEYGLRPNRANPGGAE